MSVYVIGDIHGCFQAFMSLLTDMAFDPAKDQLWLTGDLVNRGDDSLSVLTFLMSLPADSLRCVLGNHDIYALMRFYGYARPGTEDTLSPVLTNAAAMAWLRACPLLVLEGSDVLLHAGCLPLFSLSRLSDLARDAEAILRSERGLTCLQSLYQTNETAWSVTFDETAYFRFIINMFTRLRYCSRAGEMNFHYKASPEHMTHQLWHAWFELYPFPAATRFFFGHWSSLGLRITPQYCCLDSGCVWGGHLTALRKEDGRIFQVRHPIARL